MQSTGHGSRHFSQPLHSSGMITTSMPWLKMAPNCGGQCRMQVSQLMQIDMSISSGGFCHFGFRSRLSSRSARDDDPTADTVAPARPALTGGSSSVLASPVPDPERRLTSQGLERRQQLLDAASRLFAANGYAETRVVDICREAGVAKGLFYWYFDTKEAVFRDLAAELRQRLRRAQAAAMDPAADPLVRIRQGSEASVRFMSANAQAFALVTVENVDRQFLDDIRQGTEVHADDTERLVRLAVDAGLVRDEDPRLLAYAVLTTVGWFTHFHHTGRLDVDVDGLAAFVGRQVVCSIAASEGIARAALEAPAVAAG